MIEKSHPISSSRVEVSLKEKLSYARETVGLRKKVEMVFVPDRSKNEKIQRILSTVSNYDLLYQHLKKFGGIKTASNGFITTDVIIKAIDDFRQSKPDSSIQNVTRESGLRDKVKELEINSTDRGFYQLFHNIRKIKELRGSKGLIRSEVLIQQIQDVRDKKQLLQTITNTAGLRDKVDDLMKQDAEISSKIKNVDTFGNLFAVLTEIGGLDSSKGYRSANVLIDLIQKVIDDEIDLKGITNTGGLRDKVRLLLSVNDIMKPNTENKEELVAQP